ncbi:MAG: hypothetical protein E7104_07500 [Prevotella sp.]|nr:hypothetical protein [Prevotella sp.]
MKQILFFFIFLLVLSTTGCRYKTTDLIAPEGDTVAQAAFLPPDTAAINARKRALQAKKDSLLQDSLIKGSLLQDSLSKHAKRR